MSSNKLHFVTVLGLAATLLNGTVLQKKNPDRKGEERKEAKGLTREEFVDELARIIKRAWELWGDDSTFINVTFMMDNPSVHQLSKADIKRLKGEGYLKSKKQLQYAPKYSGDFQQCIEHVHAIICQRWWMKRMRMGGCELKGGWEVWEGELRAIFFEMISAKGVQANVKKLKDLLAYIAHEKTGDYARADLV